MSDPTENGQSPVFAWGAFAGKIGAIAAIIASWLFLAGWSWAYFWFGRFGIGISSLDMDNRVLPLWGLVVLSAYWWQAMLALILLVALASAATRARVAPDLIVAGTALTLAAAFAVGFKLGDLKADRDYARLSGADWPSLVSIAFETKLDSAPEGSALARLADESTSRCWRVLYYNAASFYLIRPIRGRRSISLPVHIIDRTAVAWARIGPSGVPLCTE